MQFQVPQFIEVEDKIFGPLTFKQFVYLLGGAGFSYLLARVLPLWGAGPLIIVVVGLAVALAFVQWNSRPFVVALEHAFYYLLHPKLYLWSHENRKKAIQKPADVPTALGGSVYVPHLSESRLKELSWSLDIQERIGAGIASGEDRSRAQSALHDIVAPIRTSKEALNR